LLALTISGHPPPQAGERRVRAPRQ